MGNNATFQISILEGLQANLFSGSLYFRSEILEAVYTNPDFDPSVSLAQLSSGRETSKRCFCISISSGIGQLFKCGSANAEMLSVVAEALYSYE
jgi:hypothetical protein